MLREKYQHDIFITNRHIRIQGHYSKKNTSKYLGVTDVFGSAGFCLDSSVSSQFSCLLHKILCTNCSGTHNF